ncbi:MAG: hypothetical protein M5U28_51265 [Sandaracinaceae bacterium]|nr:hypothetical protein [Sandaracinaceae bacterium]
MAGGALRDVLGWLAGVGAGLVVDAAHAVAWRAWLRRAYGDEAFTLIVALLAATPVAIAFTATVVILSRKLSVARAVVVFLVVAATCVLQSALLVEAAFPGMLPPVAIGGRALGLLTAPAAFGAAVWVAHRRRRTAAS